MAMETRFDPASIEGRWYDAWEKSGLFHPEPDRDRTPYTIVIPPPNVTGALHMGHALNNVLQDIYVRRARMLGLNALWVPGTDHAGIATQNVVEKQLLTEGLRKEDLGREAFVARVWEWKREHGGRITDQLRRLGCSLDWERERFTLDDGLSRAVREVFVRLHEKGLVYRDEALVNWCPRCLTTLSNEECPAREETGSFWELRYPLAGEEGRSISVSTTRPETMLGDTAVAVHPDDERYADLVGKTVILPLAEREIPIVADAHADPEKGSGAVKITPAHDFDDFEVGKRHDLPRVVVIGADGKMTADAGEAYAGLDRFEARDRVVADLRERGLLGAVEDRQIPLPRCYRCDTPVEPHLSIQWFVKMRPLLEPAADSVKAGRVRIVPERYTKLYLEWVEKYVDWPISRQLWWGHRIPVYYCSCGETIVSREDPEECPACGGAEIHQDEDVLDTWFSSQLWPFSTLGWPEETEDLAAFYPTELLVTARDIIYFWVARMVMAGLEFMGREPFHTVLIHGTILDEQGRRMSKSLGNGIDPIEMVERYGADAVRFSLMMLAGEGQDIKLSESRFEMGRNFANKLWNASRFTIMNLEGPEGVSAEIPAEGLAFEDRWILSRLNRTIRAVTVSLDDYRLNDAASTLYDFVWKEFCDWYLEIVKPRLYSDSTEETALADRAAVRATLAAVLSGTLRLLQPFIPFVTEEIHDHLVKTIGRSSHLLAGSTWPKVDDARIDAGAEAEMSTLIGITRTIRNIRAEMHVPESARLDATVSVKDVDARGAVLRHSDRIANLARLSSLDAEVDAKKPAGAAFKPVGEMEVYLPLGGVIDVDAEWARVEKERVKVEGQLRESERKLGNRDFLEKAPADVVEREESRRDELATRLTAIQRHLASLEDLRT